VRPIGRAGLPKCYETLKGADESLPSNARGMVNYLMAPFVMAWVARQLSADLELLSSSAGLTARVWI